jgi:peptidyl-prolyl cis-trans isomerase C
VLSQRWYETEAAARAALATGGEPHGEAIALPAELPSHSETELAARFGPAFATAAFAAPDGRWSGPIASSYGHHLVRVRERTPSRRSALDDVRAQVREALLAERSDAAVRAGIAALRSGG